MIGVSVSRGGLASRAEALHSRFVIPAKIIQVGNVIFGLRGEYGHPVVLEEIVCLLISVESSIELIQTDQAHGHIVQCSPDTLGIPHFPQFQIRALVSSKSRG